MSDFTVNKEGFHTHFYSCDYCLSKARNGEKNCRGDFEKKALGVASQSVVLEREPGRGASNEKWEWVL